MRAVASVVLGCLIAGCHASAPNDVESKPRSGARESSPEPQRRPAREAEATTVADPDAGNSPPLETRWILTNDLVNARDLGGIPTEDGRVTAYGEIYRGPPLAGLTTSGCGAFEGLGIRTVVDLRITSERNATPTSRCVMDGARVASAPLPVPYEVSTLDYISVLNARNSIVAAFSQLGDPSAYPVYFHCTWGRDRTGVLAAVILRALGVSREVVLQEYLLSEASVGAYPSSLAGALDAIEEAGGIDVYLRAAGVSDEHLETLRERLVVAD